MSREFLFRAWDGFEMRLSPSSLETEHLGSWFESHSKWHNKSGKNDTVFMQFTGLLDSKGIRIFEGDILKVTTEDGDESTHEVYYGIEHDYPAFDLRPSFESECNELQHVCLSCDTCEVIGNIYDNPELLTN